MPQVLSSTNVVAGELWLVAGQSNAQISLKYIAQNDGGWAPLVKSTLKAATDPNLRLLTVPLGHASKPQDEFLNKVGGVWQASSSGAAGDFSALVSRCICICLVKQ